MTALWIAFAACLTIPLALWLAEPVELAEAVEQPAPKPRHAAGWWSALRRTPIRAISDKRRAALAANGFRHLSSTLVALRRADTGPSRRVRRLVAKRSGGRCEWPGCWAAAVDTHHRLNRKIGGRHGAAAEMINEPEWLLHACREHHAYVTSPSGAALDEAQRTGWLLLEGQDAAVVLVLTRHAPDPVRLLPSGLVEEIGR